MRKYSKKREAILEVLKNTDVHPTAEWVYNQLKSEYPGLSLATVYRNIADFESEGKIVSVGVVNGLKRYDGDVSQHMHFICEECGRVTDVRESDSIRSNLPEELKGAEITQIKIIFHGICADCLENKSA